MFGVDKWMEERNQRIASLFDSDIRKFETLYRNDVNQQVEAFKQNAMAGYKELWQLRDQRQYLSDANQFLKDELTNRESSFRETSAIFVERSDIKSQAGARCQRQNERPQRSL